MENLDLKSAELGRALAGQKGVNDKLLTDALAVLEEQGVYAFFLFLSARGKQPGKVILEGCAKFLRETPATAPLLGNGELWEALQKLGRNLDSLLFARDLLLRALVYGRYHVKARDAARAATKGSS